MTYEDRWCLELLDHDFEMLHERGNREPLDGRWIAVERFDLDLEPRIRWSEDAVALGFIARDPVLPAARRHPEAMNQYDRIGTFRLRGHGVSPCGSPDPFLGWGFVASDRGSHSGWCTYASWSATSPGS